MRGEKMKTSIRDMALAALFASLTAAGAYIKIPLPYIPLTMQCFFCLFSGILLGSKLGLISQVIYVLTGLVGIPIFTNGGGPQYIFQPTFGYIIGFAVGAYVTGKVFETLKKVSIKNILVSSLSGLACIYLLGLPYMYLIYNLYLDKAKSFQWVFYWGFLTCIGGDLLSSIILALTARRIIPVLKSAGLIKHI